MHLGTDKNLENKIDQNKSQPINKTKSCIVFSRFKIVLKHLLVAWRHFFNSCTKINHYRRLYFWFLTLQAFNKEKTFRNLLFFFHFVQSSSLSERHKEVKAFPLILLIIGNGTFLFMQIHCMYIILVLYNVCYIRGAAT